MPENAQASIYWSYVVTVPPSRGIIIPARNGLRLLKYDDPPCFVFDGVAVQETHIEAFCIAKFTH